MSAPRRITDKPCAECGRPFRPGSWKIFHNPEACHNLSCGRKRSYRRGRCAALIAGIKRAAATRRRATVERLVGQLYGELSLREIGLFNLGRAGGRMSYDEVNLSRVWHDTATTRAIASRTAGASEPMVSRKNGKDAAERAAARQRPLTLEETNHETGG